MAKTRQDVKAARAQFALDQYNAGGKIKDICALLQCTPPTLYRLLKQAEETNELNTLSTRKPSLWNLTGIPSGARQDATRRAWDERQTKEQRTIRHAPKGTPTVEILGKLNLSYARDTMGHHLYRGDAKIYLTDKEFDVLLKRPLDLLRAIAPRINKSLGGEE